MARNWFVLINRKVLYAIVINFESVKQSVYD